MENELICLGHRVRVHRSSGDFDLVEGFSPPRTPGPPPHHHTTYREFFYVLEGTLQFVVDGQVVQVPAGESIDLVPHSLHSFANVSDQPCRWLNMHSPKGFLAFFETFSVDPAQPEAYAASVDGALIQRMLERATSYDIHFAQP